jgi:hypothetical protein
MQSLQKGKSLHVLVVDFVKNGLTHISSSRLDVFRERLSAVFAKYPDEDFLPFDQLLPDVNEGLANMLMFGQAEARLAVAKMNELNEIMEADGAIYKV